MTTSINYKKEVKVDIVNYELICTDFIVSQDKSSLTISMTLKNVGTSDALLSVNNFCLKNEQQTYFAQQCYINDGMQFEVISGWKSFLKNRSYTVITKYALSPNLTNNAFCYKTAIQHYLIFQL